MAATCSPPRVLSCESPPFSYRCPGVPLAWRDRFQSSISEEASATVAFSPRRSKRRPAGGAATTACLAPSPVREARVLVIAPRTLPRTALRFVSCFVSLRVVSNGTSVVLCLVSDLNQRPIPFCFWFQAKIRGYIRCCFCFRLHFRPLCVCVFFCRDLTWSGLWFCCVPTCPFLRCS